MLSWLNTILETHCCCSFLAVKYCLPQHHLILALKDNISIRLVPGFPSVCLLQPAQPGCGQPWHPAAKPTNFECPSALPTNVTGSCVGITDRKKHLPNLIRWEHTGLRAWYWKAKIDLDPWVTSSDKQSLDIWHLCKETQRPWATPACFLLLSLLFPQTRRFSPRGLFPWTAWCPVKK